jgi:hypothetical protein
MLPQIQRREFLAVLAAGAALTGCGPVRVAAPRARVIDAHSHSFPPESGSRS